MWADVGLSVRVKMLAEECQYKLCLEESGVLTCFLTQEAFDMRPTSISVPLSCANERVV
jgi:hypothetical protein